MMSMKETVQQGWSHCLIQDMGGLEGDRADQVMIIDIG